ncbi:hypothetical protein Ahy_B02g057738 [Arachis hypogaea]|uniref:Zinc finger GRF-type domain-containing protein n=1 Tax=Arachis hypogaea TaxID=3818 RepID=A0A445ACS2_ARAHY|nr:hypothetical protein Ahy_B02g057738 [Arachis hypogaea]
MKSMIGSSSKSVGSFNNQRSNGGWRTTRSREELFPEWCGCGRRPVLRWSRTDANPGRPFFGCPNYNVISDSFSISAESVCRVLARGGVGCLFGLINSIKKGESRGKVVPKNENDEEWRMNFAWKIGSLESDVRALKLGGTLLVVINLLVVAMLLWKW